MPAALVCLAIACLGAGCAATGLQSLPAGSSTDEVLQRAGPPTAKYERAGQQRWEYASGPAGQFTWMVDVDAAGKVLGVNQVLTEADFARVQPGETTDELRWQLGRPSETRGIWRGASLWGYRYFSNACFWFVVTVEPTGVVRDSGYVPDPTCEAGKGDRSGS
jgi:hypothetical protein